MIEALEKAIGYSSLSAEEKDQGAKR